MYLELIDTVFATNVAAHDQAHINEVLGGLREFYHAHRSEIDARVDGVRALTEGVDCGSGM